MTVDTLLRGLARIPRPHVSPFWSARVTARATAGATRLQPVARASRVMWLYWTALAAVGGPLLLTSWQRLAFVAFGAVALRAVIALTARMPASATSSRTPEGY
jgi:hypothetical protein